MSRNNIVHAPNGRYSLHMSPNEGDLIVYRGDIVVWRVNGQGAEKCFMQPDGNLVLKLADSRVTWTSHTSGNQGADLHLDNEGQLLIVLEEGTPLWLAGMPQGQYSNITSHVRFIFPIRAAFYYPWYPETWTVKGNPVRYTPTLGRYQSSDAAVQRAHVDMLEYANVDIAIASWLGPDTHLDRARLTNLLNSSKGRSLKWTIYHEEERLKDQTM